MLDYAALQALATVVREGSFERAAHRLHITPSAVSQRIKLLEERVGQTLVVRGVPCTGTEAGRRLCLHVEQVALLENELRRANPTLVPDPQALPPTLKLAVNGDSLATWFMGALAAFTASGDELLDIRIDDQDHTAQFIKEGDVLAAVTATAGAIAGCDTVPLGTMTYVAAASPAFVARHLPAGADAPSLARAPQMTFDRRDRLQDNWLRQEGLLSSRALAPRHFLPSVAGYVRGCEIGMGWGMHPLALVQGQLDQGLLVEIKPGARLDVPLYWVYARSAKASLARLTRCVLAAAPQGLHSPPGATSA
ncbi:MAG: putative HTH-type transcriptional regulator [Paracidovorax wautersii]|uniref:Putative HTH-type transcriptional regulator n=1 Tax=Paracidovorax wautersii TaxID=1177982 RepID=A0A7V8FPU3_9BURK|nr:MAG: putative HTH-type transcriptional regulator [Paracidovorax wautersii]